MPKRIAITIAGAVSLGSYEAGVMYELFEALRMHNEAAGPDDKIYVDIVTGASAGGMTAAMLGQTLMFRGGEMQGEFTNPLYKAWVETIDIRELVRLRKREMRLKWHSLLSSDLITRIGNAMLIKPMQGSITPTPHNVVECDDKHEPLPLCIGLALTNLNGIDHRIKVDGVDEGFNYTECGDERLFEITQNPTAPVLHKDTTKTATWADLRDAAVASGAFPVAFRAQEIKRSFFEYQGYLPVQPCVAGGTADRCIAWPANGTVPVDPQPFAYCDGGVLQNQPLGIAKNFVDEKKDKADTGLEKAQLADDRLYVFVSPHAVTSQADNALKAGSLTIKDELLALGETYTRQATFHDWIKAEDMNRKVRLLDTRATELCNNLESNDPQKSLDTACLVEVAEKLNRLLGVDEKALHRLQVQYGEEYECLVNAKGVSTAESFIKAMAALEKVADLQDRDVMTILAVIADGKRELAGSGISAFTGFFSRSFREHDYWVGRIKARMYLQSSDVKKALNVTKWPREASWGKTEAEAKVRLPNPSGVQAPVSLWAQVLPGVPSLLSMVCLRIRPWVLVVCLLLGILFATAFGIGLWKIGWWFAALFEHCKLVACRG